jgi:hypothetical protein
MSESAKLQEGFFHTCIRLMTVMVGQRGGSWAMRFGGPNVD